MRFTFLLAASFCLFFPVLFGQHPINPVIGDTSYLVAFGKVPGTADDEQVRISTHLSYAEERLRSADCSGLTPEQLQARSNVLDLLHQYWQRGQFPVNTACENERRPCFIDENGTICAVGYLVEQTAGRVFAEQINNRYQYDVIADMQLPQLVEWAAQNGLTLRECAMIQPAYSFRQPDVIQKGRTGIYAGYTSAFAKSDALHTRPGFEIGGFYVNRLYDRFWLQGGVGYVVRNNELNVAGATFDLRNDRWSASLLLHYYPPFKQAWSRRFSVKAGLQVDFYDAGSPVTAYNTSRYVRNAVRQKRSPELLAVGEITYRLNPLKNKINQWVSVAYLQGLRTTFEGEAAAAGQSVLYYGNSGSYLSVRYTFSLVRTMRVAVKRW